MEDIVVGKEEKIVRIVEASNGVCLLLEEIPLVVKLINAERRFHGAMGRLDTDAHQTLQGGREGVREGGRDGGREGGRREGISK